MIKNYLDYVTLCTRMAGYHRTYHKEGSSPIPDVEYDRLRKDLIEWETNNPNQTLDISPTYKVGHIDQERRNDELRHEYPMQSLENALDEEERKSWTNLWITKYGSDVEVVGEFKYDGLAISLRYIDGSFIRAMTRGDGEYGEDVTKHVAQFVPESIPAEGIIEIRGEAIVKKKALDLINTGRGEKYSNARSAVAGIVNPNRTDVSRWANYVSFIPYDIEGADLVFATYTDKLETLKQLTFEMSSCFIMTPDKIEEGFRQIQAIREAGDIPFEIDGMVFKLNSMKYQLELGETSHAPRHSFAYKFPPIVGECQLMSVVFQVGRSGEIAAVAKITATPLMGVLVTSVFLHNEDRIREKKIKIGNVYEVFRSGDVIPHIGKLIKEVEGAEEIVFPCKCPSCNSPVVKRGALYYCSNTVSCPAQNVATIANAVSRDVLAIDGLAEKTVQLMIDAGLVKCVADIYKLTAEQMMKIHGYTEYSAWKMWSAINASKQTTFDRFIMALGIPEVGKVAARSLAQRIFKRSVLFDLNTPEKVLELKVPDIGPVTANNIATYFSDPLRKYNAEELLRLLNIPAGAQAVEPIEGVAGKTFVFSGSFSEPKDILENKVLAAGGFVSSSISGATDYLVVGERAGSKLRKAKTLKIDTMDERVFRSLFEGRTDDLEIGPLTPLTRLVTGSENPDLEFQQLPSGLYVGYHVEGGETFELAGSIPLSMETLHNGRPLYLSNSKEHWFSTHLKAEDFRVYEIHFEMPPHKTYDTYAEYQKVNPMWDETNRCYRYSAELEHLIDQGYHMFSVGKNEKGEIPESFIINPTHYVKKIVSINYP